MAENGSISVIALDIDGVLTDGRVTYSANGQEQKSISFRDIEAIFEARRCGIQVALITGEDTPWAEFISRRLQVEHIIRGAKDKLEAVRSLAHQLQVPLAAICYVGDSDRDAPALAAVGLGMAPSNATCQAKTAAQIVLRLAGGHGVVHEALGYILGKESTSENIMQQGEGTLSLHRDVHTSLKQIQHLVSESIAMQRAVAEQLAPAIAKVADIIVATIKHGHKVLIFGNGGNSADAQHMAAEFVGRFDKERESRWQQ